MQKHMADAGYAVDGYRAAAAALAEIRAVGLFREDV
jgi:hypothetical protein